ncbi:putative mediator of rna polymerase ii transcription subunit 26c [Quercus suber]|uniref:Mediator of rna polymerase ii transcription subunit 26c n=1 Tax=Quercus suber TaxID=58331 RepID=A0AAW0K7B0_QUESU
MSIGDTPNPIRRNRPKGLFLLPRSSLFSSIRIRVKDLSIVLLNNGDGRTIRLPTMEKSRPSLKTLPDIVDEWVKLNQPREHTSSTLMGNTVPDFAYSPNPHNGSSGSDKNNSESEPKLKVIPWKKAPPPRVAPNYKEAENDSLIFFSASTVIYWIHQFGLMLKLFVFVCFTLVKPKGKERFR